jgi:ATP-dependent protease HslVU (ClpYQ) peptidase subunit
MTCIVGIAHNNKVYIGGDSAGVSGLDIIIRKDKKVFKSGPFLIGFTSSFRMGQLLNYNLDVPERKSDEDIMQFMVTTFVDSVRECFKDGGYTRVSDSRETGGSFLVGYEKRLFHVESDFQVGEAISGYDACGCGTPYALGALRNSTKLSPLKRLEQALETAAEFSAGVAPPFFFEEM